MGQKILRIDHFIDHRDLQLIKEMTNQGAFFNDDKLTVRASKTIQANQSPTGKKQSFPFAKDWKKSPILKKENNGWYYNRYSERFISEIEYNQLSWQEQEQDCSSCTTYVLNKAALNYIERGTNTYAILNNIRLLIENNQFDITLTGLLIERFPESRLKLIIEAIRALNKGGVILGDWSHTSEQTRPYEIFRKHFNVCDYEIAINSGRYGERLYKIIIASEASQNLKKINLRQNRTFNKGVIYAESTFLKNGIQISAYDKHLIEKNKNYDRDIFPFRLEVLIRRKFFKKAKALDHLLSGNELLKGNPGKIVQRFQEDLWKVINNGIKHMKAGIEFDIFINKKRTSKGLKQSFDDLLKTRSFMDAARKTFQDRLETEHELKKIVLDLEIELQSTKNQTCDKDYLIRLKDDEINRLTVELCKYHGRDLHQNRGVCPL